MKLSLSSDFGTVEHWKHLVEFAHMHGVDKLVYWGDSSSVRFTPPFLYPNYPDFLPSDYVARIENLRKKMSSVAGLVRDAGIEFWYVFQALQIPNPNMDLTGVLDKSGENAISKLFPAMLNEFGEPDMNGSEVYKYIENQLDELIALVPGLTGVELWIMECASIQISRLRHQRISSEEIFVRIMRAVHQHLKRHNIKFIQDLHTSGGDTLALNALMNAAQKESDIIISADNVIGDYHLHLPFNRYLKMAKDTNPIQVNFDLNGEYWGRNFVPTSAIQQYCEHLKIAEQLAPEYVNGRVATENDVLTPHCNILPSKKKFYPALKLCDNTCPLPRNLDIPSFHTFGAFNAEFFCRRAKDKNTKPCEIINEFLSREFGNEATALCPIILDLQKLLDKIFYIDKNLYHGQSLLCHPFFIPVYAIACHITTGEGVPFPTEEALLVTGNSVHPVAFEGWPVPCGHFACGPLKMLEEKNAAVVEAGAMLTKVRTIVRDMETKDDRTYILCLFEDLEYFARIFRCLLKAQINYYLLQRNLKIAPFPNENQLIFSLAELSELYREWENRYPGGRYNICPTIQNWISIIGDAAGKHELLESVSKVNVPC